MILTEAEKDCINRHVIDVKEDCSNNPSTDNTDLIQTEKWILNFIISAPYIILEEKIKEINV